MRGYIDETTLVKVKNALLMDIEEGRKFVKSGEASDKIVDIAYDHEREAVVKFYYKLLEVMKK